MGENQKQTFQLSFNRFLRVAFHGSRVTSDGGLILVRELDERLGFGKLIEQHLTDTRAKNTRCKRRRETRPGSAARAAIPGGVKLDRRKTIA